MTDDDGDVIAVLDWEICTLGDPLADVGLLMVYWTDPDDAAACCSPPPTAQDGFLRRARGPRRATPRPSGRDLSQIDFYIAFGYWKLACIVEGVYARYAGGAMGSDGASGFEGFKHQVEHCARQAAAGRGAARVSGAPMTSLYAMVEQPELESPVLVMVLKGWIDAGLGADGAADVLLEQLDRRTVARFDADAAARLAGPPADRCGSSTASTRSSPGRRPSSPGPSDAAGNDVLLLSATSPTTPGWRSPSRSSTWPSTSAPGWWSASAPTPRRCPTPARRCSPPRPPSDVAGQRACVRTSVEVPAGVQGMIERRAAVTGLPALGLWAQVPHYVVGHALPGGQPRPARRRANARRRPRPAASPTSPSGPIASRDRARRADRPEPRAPGDGRASSRPRPTQAATSAAALGHRPATSWPPSSSASSASRLTGSTAGQVELGSAP